MRSFLIFICIILSTKSDAPLAEPCPMVKCVMPCPNGCPDGKTCKIVKNHLAGRPDCDGCGVGKCVGAGPSCNEHSGNNCDFCGGFAGILCDDGYKCVDDPSDNCDPTTGGADCGGICVECPDSLTPCITQYEPVCCSGSTYSNLCSAQSACRTGCTSGEC